MNIAKFLFQFFKKRMQKSGYSAFYASKVFEKRFNDFFSSKESTISQKLWAEIHGFRTSHISLFNLNINNHKDYLTYSDYYKLHPINGQFSCWIDDKLTYTLIMAPFSDYLPEYYFHLYCGEFIKLKDCPVNHSPSNNGIIDLLRLKKTLAIKPISGSYGSGFEKLAFEKNFFINNKVVSEYELLDSVNNLSRENSTGHLITEYIHAHSSLRQIWNQSPNTIRISVIRDKNQFAKIVSAYIRFGSRTTGVIDNTGKGGICRIDCDSGVFSDGKQFVDNRLADCKYHPESHLLLEGIIPHWGLISTKILEICSYIPQVIYLGFDVVATENGFKILEINSHEGIEFNQYYSPYMKHEPTKSFFERLIGEERD